MAWLLSGASAFLLAVISLILLVRERPRSGRVRPWAWLAAFGFGAAFHAWFRMLILGLSRTDFFGFDPVFLRVLSDLCLFGFAAALDPVRGVRTKSWTWRACWVGTFLFYYFVFHAWPFLNLSWIRGLGFTGGLVAAFGFWRRSTATGKVQATYRWVACFFVAWGIAALSRGVLSGGAGGDLQAEVASQVLQAIFLAVIALLLRFRLTREVFDQVPVPRSRAFFLWMPIAFVFLTTFFIVSGWEMVERVGEREEAFQRRLSLSDAQLLADVFTEGIEASAASGSDITSYPEYRRLHERMLSLTQKGSFARALYLISLKGDTPVLAVGSQRQLYPSSSVPAPVFSHAIREIRDAFQARRTTFAVHRGGPKGAHSFTIHVPLVHKDGSLVYVLGVDLDGARWLAKVARTRLAMIVVVLVFLVLLFSAYGFLVIFTLKNQELEVQKRNLDQAVRHLREAEAELARSEETFRGILNNSPNAIFGFDRDLRLIFWNRGAEKLYGYKKHEVINEKDPTQNRRVADLLGVEAYEKDLAFVFEGKTLLDEISHRSKKGMVHVVLTAFPVNDPQGRILFGMGLVQDISQHKRFEEELALANSQLKSVIDGAVNLAILVTDVEGCIRLANVGSEKLLLEPADHLRSRMISEVLPEIFKDEALDREVSGLLGVSLAGFEAVAAYAKSLKVLQRTGAVVRRDGTRIPVEFTVAGQVDGKGDVVGYIWVGIDRSSRTRAEKALDEQRERYRDLVTNLKVGVYLSPYESDGHFLEVNPAMVEIFEADSADHLLAVPVDRVYRLPEDRVRLVCKLMERGFVRDEQLEMVTLKGRIFAASMTASVKRQDDGQIFFYGTLRDVTEEKRMERSLIDEQQRLRKVAAHIGAGLCLLDKDLKIIWVNEVMSSWFGAAVDLPGSSCYASFHQRTEPCESCPSRLALQTGLSQSLEKRDTLSDGRVLDLSVTSVPIRNQNGDVDQVLELVMDVTERRRMFELLEYERALSKNVFDSISDPLMVVDAKGHDVLDINRAFTDLTGLTRLETVGRPCDSLGSRLYSTCDSPEFGEVVATGQTRGFLKVYTRSDGRSVDLEVSLIPMRDDKGQVVGVIHIGRDVSERNHLEAELKKYSEGLEVLVRERTRAFQKSEMMFRRLFESAQDGILILDAESGSILDVNPYLLQLLETTRDVLQGLSYTDVFLFEKESVLVGLLDELKVKISVFRDDAVLHSMSGREIPVELRLSWYFVEQTRVIQVHIRNIAERKKIERIKTEFVSMVSHELRTPLSAIKEGVEIVSDGTQGRLNKSQKECLEIALANIRRLNRLIGDILDISKIQSNLLTVQGAPCDVADVIDQVYALVRIEFEKRGLVLVTDLRKPLPRVLADRDRLIQVLMNLLNNAAKFTRDNSRVTVTASAARDQVLFEIRDEGPGIPEDEVTRLFGRFVQLDSTLVRRVGGTGLGLYICKNLVEAMGGRIWAESKPGEGSVFKFELPSAEVE